MRRNLFGAKHCGSHSGTSLGRDNNHTGRNLVQLLAAMLGNKDSSPDLHVRWTET